MHDPDGAKWYANWKLEKFKGLYLPDSHPYSTIIGHGNVLTYGGVSALWEFFVDGPAGLDPFDNTNAYIGVGDGNTAAIATQTDLQGTNKFREGMEMGFPDHTDGTAASSAATCTWKTSIGTTDANFAWNEWGVFNAAAAGRMLNRKVVSFGTKTSSDTWNLTVSITIV